MRIDHEKNPLSVVKRFSILYEKGLYLEARIRAVTEEGFSEVSWFEGDIRYVKHNCEIGGVQLDPLYQSLKRGASSIMSVKLKLRRWCNNSGLEISAERDEVVGINN